MSSPRVKWAGVVVKLDDGTTHAIEFNAGFITTDIKLDQRENFYSVWVQGAGRYWTEGARMAPDGEVRRAVENEERLEVGTADPRRGRRALPSGS